MDLMAFLLQTNGAPAGSRAVENAGELNNVRLQKPK
jgi:hypothetical protein